jgi:S1-C subfamily serine protease
VPALYADDSIPGSVATTRPLLEELNHETRSLFKQIAPSIVRVELPYPTGFVLLPANPLQNLDTDPDALARYMQNQRLSLDHNYRVAEMLPATIPSATEPGQGRRFLMMQVKHFVPNGIGIVLDDQSHVLVPGFVDRQAVAAPIDVATGDGHITKASFVASDLQSDLTILQLSGVKTAPAQIASERPSPGALLLVLSLNPASNRLAVWEGWEPDVSTLVNPDGSVAGFTRGGRFYSAANSMTVVKELLEHGVVRRAFLGVEVRPVGSDDPVRASAPALGALPALRITQVIGGSVAEAAGLQPEDLILSLAGQPVGDAPTFAAAIANRRGKTELTILRDGKSMTVTVALEVR